jgi:hypothetical protein
VLTGVLLGACQTVRYTPGLPYEDTQRASELRRSLDELYPPSFQAVHRVVLTAHGRGLDLMGYVLVRQPSDLRVLATAGMGSALFEVVRRGDSVMRVSRNPVRFPQRWLEKGPYHDIATMYLFRPSPEATLVHHDANRVGLASVSRDGTLREFLFDSATRRPVGYVEARRGRLAFEMTFSNAGPLAGWPHAVPRTITVTHHRMHYTLIVSVVEMSPAALNDDSFRPEQQTCTKKPSVH